MPKKEEIEYKINIVGELDFEQMPKEEFDLLINFYIDGLKKYLAEKEQNKIVVRE